MPKKKQSQKSKPYCFVSYSSREAHVNTLFPCLWIAFSRDFDLKLTPSALESGADQLSQISKLIAGCAFAVVILDGLRPNVTYEFGQLEAQKKPVILLKEKNATVDIQSLLGGVAGQAVAPVLDVNTHFSNVKSIAYAEWNRLDPADAVKKIVQEYKKKKARIKDYIEIKEPQLWS